MLRAPCIVVGVAAALLLTACSSTPAARRATRPSAAHATTTSAFTRATTPPPTAATSAPTTSSTTTIDPGTLPQTSAFPSSSSPHFLAAMHALWHAVVSGSPAAAHSAFFPESAYVRLKGIVNPTSDYANRLLGGFDADITAAHALLGSGAATAALITVNVPGQYAHWVPPGVCSNSIGYFEVANSRVVYRENGEIRSFGIASLISWRGEWYVVHLGAIVRATTQGIVDDPAVGPGTSARSTTC